MLNLDVNTMKTESLPRWLARLFTFLFYGQIVGYVLAIGILCYISVGGFPENGKLVVNANIHGDVVAPESMPEVSKALQNWSKSTFDLKLNVPGSPNLQRPRVALNLNVSLNGPVDLAKLPILLWLSGISALLLAGLGLFITYVFMKLFHSLADRRIFDHLQVNRLMYIGYSLLVYTGLSIIVQQFVEQGAIAYLEKFGYSVNEHNQYNIGFGSATAETICVLTGLCVLALAQVFNYGMELKRESELTI